MFTDSSLVIFLVSILTVIISIAALVFATIMHFRVNKIFRSASSTDIEKLLKLHSKTLEDFVRFQAEANLSVKSLDERIKKKMVDATTLRFNPFQGEGIGGNQSFSAVFANEEGDGVVITSMHTRERTNVFAKPLKNWKSEYELSTEEKQVVENSRNKK